jgi:hypothetical protein
MLLSDLCLGLIGFGRGPVTSSTTCRRGKELLLGSVLVQYRKIFAKDYLTSGCGGMGEKTASNGHGWREFRKWRR